MITNKREDEEEKNRGQDGKKRVQTETKEINESGNIGKEPTNRRVGKAKGLNTGHQ